MAAFLLISSQAAAFDREKALNVIRKQCDTGPSFHSLGAWELYLFQKNRSSVKNYLKGKNSGVFVTGTPFSQGYSYKNTLETLSAMAENDTCNFNMIYGQFFILAKTINSLKFTVDQNGIYSVYYSSDGKVISSSFMSICEGLGSLTLNKEIIVENVVTGSVIGNETVFNEVKRFEPAKPHRFERLEFLPVSLNIEGSFYKSRKACLKGQVETLDTYFECLKPFVRDFGLDSGITGGFDSRLLFVMACRHFEYDRMQFHSYLRKTPDMDYLIGKQICQKANRHFVSIPVRDVSDYRGHDLDYVMNQAMFYNDGQIRTHSFWHEELNTAGYRLKILDDKGLGFSGIGGEQYRNMERMVVASWNKQKWISYNLIKKPAGSPFLSVKAEKNLSEILNIKISSRLGIEGRNRIGLLEIKRFMNEIYIPANRGLRCSYENRISFFLLPFAEPQVSETAYGAVKFLGSSLHFEGEMINMINPEIASVESVYGFGFDKGEPLLRSLPLAFSENALPWGISLKLYNMLSGRETQYWTRIKDDNKILSDTVEIFNDYKIPIDVSRLIIRKDLGPLIFAFGYLFKHFAEKLNR